MDSNSKEPPKYCTGYAKDNEGYEALADDVDSKLFGSLDNTKVDFIYCGRRNQLVSKDPKKAREDFKRSMRHLFDG